MKWTKRYIMKKISMMLEITKDAICGLNYFKIYCKSNIEHAFNNTLQFRMQGCAMRPWNTIIGHVRLKKISVTSG